MFTVRCLDDRLPAHLAEVWNSSGLFIGGMAAEIGFDAIYRQVEGRSDFLVPQPVSSEFTDFELFGFCHNLSPFREALDAPHHTATGKGKYEGNKKIKGCSHKT